jgi:H+-translocating diphosphatase
MSLIILICVDRLEYFYTTMSFLLGAVTSMFCGALGMEIATYSNYRTTLSAQKSLGSAFKTAYRAACVMGFVLVSCSMLVLLVIILIYKQILGLGAHSTHS